MLAHTKSAALLGLSGTLVTVECDSSNSLPGLVFVGLGNKAVEEARERVRSALKNSAIPLPPKRLTINLAPGDLPKDGTGYDLAIAVALMQTSGQLRSGEGTNNALFAGELALDGSLRPIKGAISYAVIALEHGLQTLYVPESNAAEAAEVAGVTVFGVKNLLELYAHLSGQEPLARSLPRQRQNTHKANEAVVDMGSIYGQHAAKRAVEIAAAGGHNVLLSGAPGAGKTMLVKALAGLLPPASPSDRRTMMQLYSLAGSGMSTPAGRPLRAPHHTASTAAIIGGGRTPTPGDISLAHGGVLLLDELPEFSRATLEALRQPLEERHVSISRAAGNAVFPADCIVAATQNPCPCGYLGDSVRKCRCNSYIIARYQNKSSGPLLDRIDLVVYVRRLTASDMQHTKQQESSATIAARVSRARKLQLARAPAALNARLTNEETLAVSRSTLEAQRLIKTALENGSITGRGYMKALRTARTIADLSGSDSVQHSHMLEALSYRAVAN